MDTYYVQYNRSHLTERQPHLFLFLAVYQADYTNIHAWAIIDDMEHIRRRGCHWKTLAATTVVIN